jgi:hypothetical protein
MEAFRSKLGLSGLIDLKIAEGNNKNDTKTNWLQFNGRKINYEHVTASRNIR